MRCPYDNDLCYPVTVIYRVIINIHSQMEEESENNVLEEEEDVVDIDNEFEEIEEEFNDDNDTVSEK